MLSPLYVFAGPVPLWAALRPGDADAGADGVLTALGLIRYHVFFVIRLATREVQVAGIIPEPHKRWMKQVARNLTDGLDGFLGGCRYLIHDRATLFSEGFRVVSEAAFLDEIQGRVRLFTS